MAVLHYIQLSLAAAFTVLCIVLTIINALVLDYTFHRQDTGGDIYFVNNQDTGTGELYRAYWFDSVTRGYYALMVTGAVGTAIGILALIAMLVSKRSSCRFSLTGRKQPKSLRFTPVALILMTIFIPLVIVSLVISFIDNRASYDSNSICSFIEGGTEVRGYGLCATTKVLTAEQFTCWFEEAAPGFQFNVDKPGYVNRLCNETRFVRWVTVPLLILSILIIVVGLLQIRKLNIRKRDQTEQSSQDLPRGEVHRQPNLAKKTSLTDSEKTYTAPIDVQKVGNQKPLEILGSPVSEAGDNEWARPVEMQGTLVSPVEKYGYEMQAPSELPAHFSQKI